MCLSSQSLPGCGFALAEIRRPPRLRQAGWPPPGVVNPESGRRNHAFYVGDLVTFALKGEKLDRYEVRDSWGNLIDKGPAAEKITINATKPGWYKLYVYRQNVAAPKPKDPPAKAEEPKPASGPPLEELWGDIIGGTTFVIFRRNDRFPEMPGKEVAGGAGVVPDQVVRGVTGMGPQRHRADAEHPAETIKSLDVDVAIDKKFYLPFDPLRKRSLMTAFPNGTKQLEGVRKIVEHFQHDIEYWEPRNEPNYGASGADFAEKELKPFHETIKAINPKLKVMGPGTVAIGPQLLPWIEDFLKADGAKYLDAFSFHIYNGINGDLWLSRKSRIRLRGAPQKVRG